MLFCLSVNYTPKGLEEMGKNPKTNRREAVEKLLTAAGGKLVSMYATIAEGPGAMVIFDIDPAVAPAIVAVAASSDAVQNVKMQRLFTTDEMMAIRAKRVELQAALRGTGPIKLANGGRNSGRPFVRSSPAFGLQKVAPALGRPRRGASRHRIRPPLPCPARGRTPRTAAIAGCG